MTKRHHPNSRRFKCSKCFQVYAWGRSVLVSRSGVMRPYSRPPCHKIVCYCGVIHLRGKA